MLEKTIVNLRLRLIFLTKVNFCSCRFLAVGLLENSTWLMEVFNEGLRKLMIKYFNYKE